MWHIGYWYQKRHFDCKVRCVIFLIHIRKDIVTFSIWCNMLVIDLWKDILTLDCKVCFLHTAPARPTLEITPASPSHGSTITFTCKDSSSNRVEYGPYDWQFLKDGVPVRDWERGSYIYQKTASLKDVMNDAETDHAKYTCRSRSTFGTLSYISAEATIDFSKSFL